MNSVRILRAVAVLVGATALSGCKIFKDPSPHDISVRVDGTPGTLVEVIYSKQFLVGIDETGGAQVQIYQADTVPQVLPVDMVVNVEVEKRLFVQVGTLGSDSVTVSARVDVDGRNVLNTPSRHVVSSDPWRYVYLFNQKISTITDVVF